LLGLMFVWRTVIYLPGVAVPPRGMLSHDLVNQLTLLFILLAMMFFPYVFIQINNVIYRRQLRYSEEKLRRAKDDWELTFDAVPDLIMLLDLDHRVIRANRPMLRALGVGPEELVGRPCYEALHGTDSPPSLCPHCRTLADDREHTSEIEALGRTLLVTTAPIFNEEHQLQGCVHIARDITARKEGEEALRESEARFRSLFESMTEGVALHEIVYDDRHTPVDYRILDTNPAYAVHTGIKPEEVKGKLASVAYGGGAPPYLETFARVAATGQSVSFEIFVEPLGRYYYVSATSPQPGHFVTVFEDITERKNAEEALRQAHNQLEHRVKERTADLEKAYDRIQKSEKDLRFLAGQLLTAQEQERKRISFELHDDLGQSLTVLKMQLRAAARHLPPGHKAIKELEEARDYLNQTIETLRRISKALSPSLLEDMGLIKALMHLFEETCGRQHIRCNFHIDNIDGLFPPEAQVTIYRIFQEILNNISKHARADQVDLDVRNLGKSIIFSVTDNGEGFDVAQVLAGRTMDQGLGLASMEERARLIGGSLNLVSQPGTGTTINIEVPFSGGVPQLS
jgi:PAS domain S-box-containing protein